MIFAGNVPTLEDARPSQRGVALAEKCEQIPFSQIPLLDALKPIREVELKEANGKASTNIIYQMREEGDNRWLFLAHVNRVVKVADACIVIGGEEARMKNQDLPWEERLKITIAGTWKVTVYDALTGEIYPAEYSWKNGKTILKRSMYDHDSLLLWLEPGCEACAEAYVAEKNCVCKTAQKVRIPSKTEIVLSEPNVSILDLAEYRFDDGEWQPEEELLRIDNLFREKLGYPLRMEAFAQPWTNTKVEGFDHTLSLRYTIETEDDLTGLSLALENDETTKIYVDGVEVPDVHTGWYVDHSIYTVALPDMGAGTHCLQVEIPYNSKVNIECLFLLGDFSVEVEGSRQILSAAKKCAAFSDITRQGLPFYGGNVTYRIPVTSTGGEVVIRASMYRAPVMKVAVDGVEKGHLVFAPYEVNLGVLEAGEHMVELTVFGNRVNTFGTVHNCNQTEDWFGPNAWRTVDDEWAYEYQLRPTGLLKAPVVTELK